MTPDLDALAALATEALRAGKTVMGHSPAWSDWYEAIDDPALILSLIEAARREAGLDVPAEALYGLLAPDLEEAAKEEGRVTGLHQLRDAILPGLLGESAEFVRRAVTRLEQLPLTEERRRFLLEKRRRERALQAPAGTATGDEEPE